MAPNEEKYRLRIPFKEKFPEICWFCSEKIPDHLMRNFGQREQLKPLPLPFEREWILRRWKLACWKGWPKMTPVVFQPCCHHNLLDKQRIHPLILGKLTLPVKTVKLKTSALKWHQNQLRVLAKESQRSLLMKRIRLQNQMMERNHHWSQQLEFAAGGSSHVASDGTGKRFRLPWQQWPFLYCFSCWASFGFWKTKLQHPM